MGKEKIAVLFFVCLYGCGVTKQLTKLAYQNVINDTALQTAHVGISIYDAATNQFWYNYQGDKYFVPASNTKIPTCYAAMKYLDDSLAGLRYEKRSDTLYIVPTGDPTFLHPEFPKQKAFELLSQSTLPIVLNTSVWQDKPWGSGWSWNDYSEYYMAERSAMPIYGNVVRFSGQIDSLKVIPEFFQNQINLDRSQLSLKNYPSSIHRDLANNHFFISSGTAKENKVETPFYTNNSKIIFELLKDTLQKNVAEAVLPSGNITTPLYSQPTDSLLKPMMHRSDNFFAEQSLLMVSHEVLGIMNDARIIDTILKTDLKDLPQKPRWVDGSGLSRYNLFTPQDFIVILNKMRNEFGMNRIKEIFPSGGEGTLSSFYKKDSTFIYAKTGTLSGVVALSGFLYTRKNKLLLFSVLVNNHQASATAVRKAVERFLQGVRNRY